MDRIWVFYIAGGIFTVWATRETALGLSWCPELHSAIPLLNVQIETGFYQNFVRESEFA